MWPQVPHCQIALVTHGRWEDEDCGGQVLHRAGRVTSGECDRLRNVNASEGLSSSYRHRTGLRPYRAVRYLRLEGFLAVHHFLLPALLLLWQSYPLGCFAVSSHYYYHCIPSLKWPSIYEKLRHICRNPCQSICTISCAFRRVQHIVDGDTQEGSGCRRRGR